MPKFGKINIPGIKIFTGVIGVIKVKKKKKQDFFVNNFEYAIFDVIYKIASNI